MKLFTRTSSTLEIDVQEAFGLQKDGATLVDVREDREWAQGSLIDFMASLARRGQTETGVIIPTTNAEAFIRGSAEAGVLRIVQ